MSMFNFTCLRLSPILICSRSFSSLDTYLNSLQEESAAQAAAEMNKMEIKESKIVATFVI